MAFFTIFCEMHHISGEFSFLLVAISRMCACYVRMIKFLFIDRQFVWFNLFRSITFNLFITRMRCWERMRCGRRVESILEEKVSLIRKVEYCLKIQVSFECLCMYIVWERSRINWLIRFSFIYFWSSGWTNDFSDQRENVSFFQLRV